MGAAQEVQNWYNMVMEENQDIAGHDRALEIDSSPSKNDDQVALAGNP